MAAYFATKSDNFISPFDLIITNPDIHRLVGSLVLTNDHLEVVLHNLRTPYLLIELLLAQIDIRIKLCIMQNLPHLLTVLIPLLVNCHNHGQPNKQLSYQNLESSVVG